MTYANNTFFKVVVTYRLQQRIFTEEVNPAQEIEVDEVISITVDSEIFNPPKTVPCCRY